MLFLRKTEKMLNTITVLIKLTMRFLSLEQSIDALFHPTLQNAIMKSGYKKTRRTQTIVISIIANSFVLIHQSESVSGKT
uniref:Transposase n=1 Tax=Strongyloides venezuelensis TaxID=75913 RepID=A0A0K0ETY4_STRVS